MSLGSDARYETVIALRNIAWIDYRKAEALLDDYLLAFHTGLLPESAVDRIRANRNRALDDFERAWGELLRIQVWRKRAPDNG